MVPLTFCGVAFTVFVPNGSVLITCFITGSRAYHGLSEKMSESIFLIYLIKENFVKEFKSTVSLYDARCDTPSFTFVCS